MVCMCVCVRNCHWGGVGWDYLEMNLFSGRPFFSLCCSRSSVGLPLQDSGNPSTGMWTIELMAKINLAHISQQGTQLIICPYQQQPAQVGHALLILPASNSPWLQH